MSSVIVFEALALVTWWGLGRIVHGLRRAGRQSGSGEGPRGPAGRRRAPDAVYSGNGNGASGRSNAGDPVPSA
jgi:hypothetical protein